jgi:hypothetical protein
MSTKTINASKTVRRWAVPVFSVVIGIAMCAVVWAQGRPLQGLLMLGVMLVAAAVVVIFRRSEPIAMLAEESTEERRRLIQLKAGYFSVNVLAVVIVGGFLVDVLRGGDGGPWALLGFVGGASFVGAIVFYSRRI